MGYRQILSHINLKDLAWLKHRQDDWKFLKCWLQYEGNIPNLACWITFCVACEAWRHKGITLSFVCLSVRLSVCHTRRAMFRRRHMHSSECCHYIFEKCFGFFFFFRKTELVLFILQISCCCDNKLYKSIDALLTMWFIFQNKRLSSLGWML